MSKKVHVSLYEIMYLVKIGARWEVYIGVSHNADLRILKYFLQQNTNAHIAQSFSVHWSKVNSTPLSAYTGVLDFMLELRRYVGLAWPAAWVTYVFSSKVSLQLFSSRRDGVLPQPRPSV